ncbi:MAG TPA: hypothetical protein VFC63_14375 [Blastocatellia bacterium]|nr:hypothetical protein [Blastocatellia bacterium]
MNKARYLFCFAVLLALASFNISNRAMAAQRDPQTRQTIRNLDNDFTRFRSSLDQALREGHLEATVRQERIQQYTDDFQQSYYQYRDQTYNRDIRADDVQNMLQRASEIHRFLGRHKLPDYVTRNWNAVRQDLDKLAYSYNVRWDWNNPQYAGNNYTDNRDNRRDYNRLTGTYQLDRSRSDNVTAAINRATRGLPLDRRTQVRDSMQARLDAPDMISIDRQGRSVTLASSKGNKTTFDADSISHSEQVSSGRTVQMRATLNGDILTIQTTGNRNTDFTATFEPIDNGRSLRVTRNVYSDRLDQPINFTTVYNRTSDQPQWDIYTNTGNYYPPDNGRGGDFIIPNGTELTAILNTDLSTRTSREGDRFTMTVRSPAEYNGAVIEGYISNLNSSGSVTGRANMSLNFQNIRMRDGKTYRFAGFIDSVRAQNGDTLRVNNEGTVRSDDSQGTKTAERAGIGAAIGGIIGAIAGGGRGAGIGAVIGGGAGAGSVAVEGKQQLELPNGTEFRIASSAPDRR